MILFIGPALLLCAIYCTYTKYDPTEIGCCRGGVATFRALPWGKLRVPIVAFQIIVTFISITGLPLPAIYSIVVRWTGLLSFDFGWVISLGCLVRANFYQRLLIITITPIVASVLLLCSYAVTVCRNSVKATVDSITALRAHTLDRARAKHLELFLGMTFLIYSTVSTSLIQTFACDSIDDHVQPPMRYLRADYSIQCDTPQHTDYRIYAGCMAGLYVLGTPLLYLTLLLRRRQHFKNLSTSAAANSSAALTSMMLTDQSSSKRLRFRVSSRTAAADTSANSRSTLAVLPDQSLNSTKFLWKSYRPELFYWEIVECGRRLLLTGGIVFIAPGTAAQAASACVLAFFSMVVAMYAQPHADAVDGLIYYGGCLVIFLSTFMSVLMKADISLETHDSQNAFDLILVILHGGVIAATVSHMGFISYNAWKQAKAKKAERNLKLEKAQPPCLEAVPY
jgi:hypothetical protein